MANTTEVHDYCLSPFLPEVAYESFPGSSSARWCKDMPIGPDESVSCCLPCPAGRWRYDEALEEVLNNVAWSAIPVLALVLFILVSHTFLPVSATGRHFITTSATIGFIFFQIAWIIPLNSEPDMCRDEITAHNLRTDAKCGVAGGSLLFGVWIVILSCFCGALFLHLTVCWEKTLGKKFRIACLTLICGGSAGLLAVVLVITGVSYQFGKTCVINSYMSKATFWGPLLGVASATLLVEFATVVYCIVVVTRPLFHGWRKGGNKSSSQGFSNSSFDSSRTVTARAASARVRRILHLQWRAIAIVCLVLFHVALLCGAFIQVADLYDAPTEDLIGWLACLHTKESQKECVHLARGFGPDQNFFIGALILLILCPFWDFVVLIHRSTFLAWFDIMRGRTPRDHGVRGGFLAGGQAATGSKKAIIEPSNSRFSRSFGSPTPMDGMPLSVLESQKVSGWRSSTPTETRHIPTPSPTEQRSFVTSPTSAADRYSTVSPRPSGNHYRVPSSHSSYSATERQYKAPKQSFSAPGRPKFSEEEEDGYYNNYPGYGTYTTVYSPVSPRGTR